MAAGAKHNTRPIGPSSIDSAKLGTGLRVATSRGARNAVVVKKPIVDPKKRFRNPEWPRLTFK